MRAVSLNPKTPSSGASGSMDGLICVAKPPGCTSHDVVQTLRKILGIRRIGHCGTLDPDASGVLLLAVGRATRFFPFLSGQDKVYRGEIRLGFSTDTYDSSGVPTSPAAAELPGEDLLAAAMKEMEGDLLQFPPPYSAKKLGGRPLYKMARRGEAVPLKPCPVRVHQFNLLGFRPPIVDFEAGCGPGTYIRSLAHDLGQRLGCGAHLAKLERTSVGGYRLSECSSPERIRSLAEEGRAEEFLIPMEDLLGDYPAIYLNDEGQRRVRNGNSVSAVHADAPTEARASSPPPASGVYRLFSRDKRLLALARRSPDSDVYSPFLVIGGD